VQNAKPDLAHGPYPLVVFSHGFGANGPAYGFFIRQWTEAGYVVAAPTFPPTHAGTAGGPDVSDYNQQPADVSFVITKLLKKNAKPTSAIHGVIERDRRQRPLPRRGHHPGGDLQQRVL